MRTDFDLAFLKPLWSRRPDGRWALHDMKGIRLKPKTGCSPDFFAFESDMELMTSTPPKNLHDMFASFGSTDFLVKQSILPVVAWVEGEDTVRCIGTAFVVSASGYVITASHVLLDPQESGYGKVEALGGNREIQSGLLLMGVIIPLNPATGVNAFHIVPFIEAWYWGKWEERAIFLDNVAHQSSALGSTSRSRKCFPTHWSKNHVMLPPMIPIVRPDMRPPVV
jgi:hypothetical protein